MYGLCKEQDARDLVSSATWLKSLFPFRTAKKGHLRSARPAVEALESREVLNGDWFSAHLPNVNVAALARADYAAHDSINYNDMLVIYGQVEKDGVVTSNDFASLQALASNGAYLNSPASVSFLETQVINQNPANLTYQGSKLGYLAVGSPTGQLQLLVDKWFLGEDHPAVAANEGLTYTPYTGLTFGTGGPTYTDVAQGAVGDCWLLSSLAVTAYREPGVIESMFTFNGNNTDTVRFFENGSPVYVTVDNMLPTQNGNTYYDHVQNGVLWVALAEKAYAELNAYDPLITSQSGSNSYASLNNAGFPQLGETLATITGNTAFYSNPNSTTFLSQMLNGKLAVLGSDANPSSSYIVGGHVYAVLNYSNGIYTVFNPWGIQAAASDHVYGLFQANASFLASNFSGAAWGGAMPAEETINGSAGSFLTPAGAGKSVVALASNPTAATNAVYSGLKLGAPASSTDLDQIAAGAKVSPYHAHLSNVDAIDLLFSSNQDSALLGI